MIASGEVVEVGEHRMRCGDLLDGSVKVLMAGERADIVYSDPPWGEGNVRYWRTQNGQRDEAPSFDWPTFISAFCQTVADSLTPTGIALVEMGLRWTGDLRERMQRVGFEERGAWVVRYAVRLPCSLQLFSRQRLEAMPENLANRTGIDLVRRALRPYAAPGLVVLDPCTGLGNTAKLTDEYGMRFRGNELNPRRLQRTIDVLQRRVDRRSRSKK